MRANAKFYTLSVLSRVGVSYLKRAFEEVFGKGVDWVFGLFQADILQSFGEESNKIVL